MPNHPNELELQRGFLSGNYAALEIPANLLFRYPDPENTNRFKSQKAADYIEARMDEVRKKILKNHELEALSQKWPDILCVKKTNLDNEEYLLFLDTVSERIMNVVVEVNKKLADEDKVKLLIVYGDIYIGYASWGRGRPTMGSMTTAALPQIGIWWHDHDTKHILTHEFIHSFGKKGPRETGKASWLDPSSCKDSMQNTFGRDRCGASPWKDDLILHKVTYDEIISNGCRWLFDDGCK